MGNSRDRLPDEVYIHLSHVGGSAFKMVPTLSEVSGEDCVLYVPAEYYAIQFLADMIKN